MQNKAKILVPVDFSSGSSLAIEYAVELAKKFDAEIHLLNVIEDSNIGLSIGGDPLNTSEHAREKAIKELDKFIPTKFRSFDFIKQAANGAVYEVIIDYAKDYKINLIVMGSNGKTGFVSAWLGGTTYEVTRKAPCAVLTVKPEGLGFLKTNN